MPKGLFKEKLPPVFQHVCFEAFFVFVTLHIAEWEDKIGVGVDFRKLVSESNFGGP